MSEWRFYMDNKDTRLSETGNTNNDTKSNINNENNEYTRYNTYEERGHMNIPAVILSVISIFILCCIPFQVRYKPICYIDLEEGKLMLAMLLTMAFFYFLCFDMVAFCVASVNMAFLIINTYEMFIYARSDLLRGFYLLWTLSFLIMVVNFLYPFILKKIKKRKKQ